MIDARAPRTNQAVVGVVALFAVLTDWWVLLALLAVQLALGLTRGRRWCLACVFYYEVLQPRFGEGPLEDSRPPRFAKWLGSGSLARPRSHTSWAGRRSVPFWAASSPLSRSS